MRNLCAAICVLLCLWSAKRFARLTRAPAEAQTVILDMKTGFAVAIIPYEVTEQETETKSQALH